MPNPTIKHLIYSIDYDGCAADPLVLVKIIEQLKTDLEEYPNATVHFVTGSGRQTINADKINWDRNQNSSAYTFLTEFVTQTLPKAFPSEQSRFQLDGLLLEDIVGNKAPGETLQQAINSITLAQASKDLISPAQYTSTLSPDEHWRRDEFKRDLLYTQLQHFSEKTNSEATIFRFFDDRKDILETLYDWFQSQPVLIPQEITLTLHQQANPTLTGQKPLFVGTIVGTGQHRSPMTKTGLQRFLADVANNKEFIKNYTLSQLKSVSQLNTSLFNSIIQVHENHLITALVRIAQTKSPEFLMDYLAQQSTDSLDCKTMADWLNYPCNKLPTYKDSYKNLYDRLLACAKEDKKVRAIQKLLASGMNQAQSESATSTQSNINHFFKSPDSPPPNITATRAPSPVTPSL